MNTQNNTQKPITSRRDFLKATSGVIAGTALAGAIGTRAYAGESNTIKIALVGCGGRGTGAAANALSTRGPTKLVAMADVFEQRLESSLDNLDKSFAKQSDVPAGRRFLGHAVFPRYSDLVHLSSIDASGRCDPCAGPAQDGSHRGGQTLACRSTRRGRARGAGGRGRSRGSGCVRGAPGPPRPRRGAARDRRARSKEKFPRGCG